MKTGSRKPALLALTALAAAWGQATLPQPGQQFTWANSNAAWSFFSDPRAVYYKGQKEKVYLGSINRQGSIQVWSYDYATAAVDTFTLRSALQVDDHDLPALYVGTDGRISAFYQRHDNDLIVRIRTTINPEDITSWGTERILNMPSGATVTYANPMRLSGEGNRLYLFNRSVGFHPTVLTSSNEGLTWSAAAKLIGGPGARPYIKYATDGARRIHFAFTDGHPRNEPTNSIYYAYYENGLLFRANGTPIKAFSQIPLEPSESERVYNGASSTGRAWIWDVALDAQGYPVLAFVVAPTETDHRYYYARWNGTQWLVRQIVAAGKWFPQTPTGTTEPEPHYSGGMILNPEDPSEVFLSRPFINGSFNSNGIFEIQRWRTTDLGATWTTDFVTSGSSKNNVRPIVPWPVPGQSNPRRMVLWMHGDYVHYTNYSTGVKYAFLPPDPSPIVPVPRRTRVQNPVFASPLFPFAGNLHDAAGRALPSLPEPKEKNHAPQ